MPFDIIIGRDQQDLKLFGNQGMVLIGRAYVKMGRTTSLSNNIYLDIARGHVVYITGKRGSGKCLLGDTLITLEDGRQIPIKDLESIEGNILALDDKLKIIPTRREGFYKRKVNRILEIKFRSGKKISLTPEHPLLTISGWKEAQKLPIYERIATPLKHGKTNLSKNGIKTFANFAQENYNRTLLEKNHHCSQSQLPMQIQASSEEEIEKIIIDSDIFWDQIMAIEEKTGEFEVYDITVPELHNFVANDIIVHNSYTMGAIAEGVMDLPNDVRKNLSMIMFDTMGVYWTMKYPNQKDEDLLEQWGMKSRGMDVKIYTPYGFFQKYKDGGIPTDYPFSIKASDLTSQDWILSFELKGSDPVAIIIEKTIGDFLEIGKTEYNIRDIIDYIHNDNSFSLEIRNEAINRFRTAERWGLFSDEGMNLMDLIKPGEITVMDLSPYVSTEGGWGVKALVIGLIGMRVFSQRMLARKAEELETINVGYSYFQVEEEVGKKEPLPIVWLVVDEAQEFLPKEGKTAATDALVIILREGRQPGVSLILATQQPGKIHTDVMSQSDIVLSHRLTAKPDVDALATMSQSYMTKSLPRMLDELPRVKGCALLLDDSSERFYEMQVRPRLTWHGGAAPTAIKYRRKLELGL